MEKARRLFHFNSFPPICTQINLNWCFAEITGAASHVSGGKKELTHMPLGLKGVVQEKKMIPFFFAKLQKTENNKF